MEGWRANRRLWYSLGVVILLAVVYAIVSRTGGPSDIPELARWTDGADEIVIAKSGVSVRMFRDGGGWRVGDEGFPADPEAAGAMEKKLLDLSITQMVSRMPHYEQYNLMPEKGVEVAARRAGRDLRRIVIGRQSGKSTHTYIRLDGRPEIFKASGTLSYDFDKTVESLRDRAIVNIAADDITGISLRRGKSALTFVKEAATSDGKGAKDGAAAQRWVCAEHRGVALHDVKMETLVKSFGPLKARGFPSVDPRSLKNPLCAVTVTTKGGVTELKFYPGDSEYGYYCTTSISRYVYDVARYLVEQYFKDIKGFGTVE